MRKIRGFTLIELLVVLAIIGLMLAIAVPALYGISGNGELRMGAQLLASRIRIAQAQSMAGMDRGIKFIRGTEKHQILDRKTGEVIEEYQLQPGVKISSSNFSSDRVFFSEKGGPSRAGTVTLAGASGKTINVRILVATGRIRIQ